MKNTHTDCLFCQIAQGDIPAEFVFENEDVVAFRDIAPAAPVHLLFVPKKHITSANDFANGADATVVKGSQKAAIALSAIVEKTVGKVSRTCIFTS